MVFADLHWLARAISNLIGNACDFAKDTIYVSAKRDEHYLYITVEDDGPGIAPENFNNVFSPFFREESHRNRADKSYGLGLAIVAKVADWHHGSVSVSKSARLQGACFTLKIGTSCFKFPDWRYSFLLDFIMSKNIRGYILNF